MAQTDPRALQEAANAVLFLINSQPRTPKCEQIAAAIAANLPAPASKPVDLSPEGEAFRQAAEWEIACVRATRNDRDSACVEAFAAHERVRDAARRVWMRPAATFADVVARMLVAAHFRTPVRGAHLTLCHDGGYNDAIGSLIIAIERVSGIRRPGGRAAQRAELAELRADRVSREEDEGEVIGFLTTEARS